MRNLKKVLALVLALVMTMSLVTIANAAEFSDQADISYEEAVDVMTAIGVLEGFEDGSFQPDATLTREQATKIICTMLLGDNAEKLGTTSSSFSDVPSTRWSAPYIEYCASLGIVAGNGDGTFNPTGLLTGHAFGKMLLVALGFEGTYTGSKWAINVAADLVDAELDDGLDGLALNAQLTREEAAQLGLNGLKYTSAKTVYAVDDNGQIVTFDNLNDALLYVAIKADPVNVSYVGETKDYSDSLLSDVFNVTVATGLDDLSRPATTYSHKDWDEDMVYTNEADYTIVVDKSGEDANYWANEAKRNMTITGTTNVFVNTISQAETTDLQVGDVVTFYGVDNNVAAKAVVARYSLAKIDDVDTEVSATDEKNDVSAYISLEKLDGTAYGNGTYNDIDIVGYKAADYTEGTVLAVAMIPSGDDMYDIADSYVADTAEGAVTGFKTDNSQVTLGGTKYDVIGTIAPGSITNANVDFADGSYVAYLTKEGYVMGLEGIEAVSLDDVYYVVGVYKATAANGSSTYYAQVVNLAGEQSELKLEADTYNTTFSGSASENTYTAVKGLYTFDDKDTSGTNKANNGKLNATAYTTGVDDTYYVYGGANALSADMTKSDNSVTIGGRRIYLEKETQYVVVEGDTADITVKTAAGGVNFVDSASETAYVIAAKSGANYVAKYVVLADDTVSAAVDSASVLYIAGKVQTKVADGYQGTVYFMDGTKLEDAIIDIEIDGTTHKAGFYTFNLEDGVYELTYMDPANDDMIYGDLTSAGFTYDHQSGAVEDATISGIYSNKLSLLNIVDTNVATFADVDLASNVQIIDTRTTSERDGDAYRVEVNSQSKLEAAMDNGVVVADFYFDDGEVMLIAVESVEETVELSATPSSTEIANAFTQFDQITVADLSGATGTTVPTGKELIVEDDVSATEAGYLSGNGTVRVNGKLTVTTMPTATLTWIAEEIDASGVSLAAGNAAKLLTYSDTVEVGALTMDTEGAAFEVEAGQTLTAGAVTLGSTYTLTVNGTLVATSIDDATKLDGAGKITIGTITGTVTEAKTTPVITGVTVDKFEAGAKVTLTFNVALDKTTAETVGNYTFADGTSQPGVASATLSEDGKSVVIVTETNAIEASATTLKVTTDVKNFAGVAFGTTDAKVTFGATADAAHTIGDAA